ncbi:hypothetical protein F5148DRAFT_1275922 [Russula earlei]|uniref:Uncharacterized protein n=1 Tax=Russula earlei TaxID=71964 RepID=A0ACC0UA80_9AGAM|nr:hypothetical protein F5148DRAFT_1275922 [Russula earlei]
MSQSDRDGKATEAQAAPLDQEGFLYSVLNLPDSASAEEIRERYKTLSVLFHPDKQREESTKDTASRRFLEIQKAYEAVYDIYGFEGTRLKWPPELRSKPRNELVKTLNRSKWEHEASAFQDSVRPQGRLVVGVNASSLFNDRAFSAPSRESFRSLNARLHGVRISSFTLRHSFQVFDDKTKVVLTTRAVSGRAGASNVLGTVKHQYSPRLYFEATTSLLRAHFVMMRVRYQSDEGTYTVQTSLYPSFEPALPPITVAHSRRLFRESMTQGVLICHTGHQPHFSINIVFPHRFGTRNDPMDADDEESPIKLGSWTGFGTGVRQSSCGITLAGLGTSLKAEWGLVFPELAAQASLAMQLSIAGLGWVATGAWGDEHAGITTVIGLNAAGVELTLNFSYLGQRLVLPIVLSENSDTTLACLAATLPSAAFMLAYQFILRPRRRKQRAEFYRHARKELHEERSNIHREIEEMTLLLRETARKHTHAEKSKEGLVILEASYGPTDPDPEARDLIVDVTVAIQALVRKSQLYIPGHRPKSGLQGFYDPAPRCAKSLRIRYTFGGRAHYCEVPDYKPVVLPLGVPFSLVVGGNGILEHLVGPVL